jgi:hypothetical protein
MAGKICATLGAGPIQPLADNSLSQACQASDWDVWVVDWQSKAADKCRIPCPWVAAGNASDLGENVALNLKVKNYSHIHFIAHSAGAGLIDFATIGLRFWVPKENRRALQIHETFLDAYEPSLDASRYGKQADWSDNYVDTRSLIGFDLDGTKLFLQNSYNVDVTPVMKPVAGYDDACQANSVNPITVAQCRHSRPYRFYDLSVDSSSAGDGDPFAAYDLINGTGGMGYPLSLENGYSLNLLNSLYPTGAKCVMAGDVCYKGALPANASSFLPGAIASTVVSATTGGVNYVVGVGSTLFNVLTLGEISLSPNLGTGFHTGLSAATPTELPSSITAHVMTTQPVNTVRFNWSFSAVGEGFLRVFVDGILMREIDQRHASPASLVTEQIYIGGEAGTLPPATHSIVFRLDGFGTSASGVQLTGVEMGLTSSPTARRRAVRQ